MSFFTLKIIALLSMLWDHVTHVCPLSMTLEGLLYPNAARSEEHTSELQSPA